MYAGNKVEGSKIFLFKSESGEVWAMNHTGNKGEFTFSQIPPGNYTIAVTIPLSSFAVNQKEKEKLEKLIDGGCDKENGRLVFKLNDNCFVLDINCEKQEKNVFTPNFKITEKENEYMITIADAQIHETFDLIGLFESLTAQYYKRCLESGKFKLIEGLQSN